MYLYLKSERDTNNNKKTQVARNQIISGYDKKKKMNK